MVLRTDFIGTALCDRTRPARKPRLTARHEAKRVYFSALLPYCLSYADGCQPPGGFWPAFRRDRSKKLERVLPPPNDLSRKRVAISARVMGLCRPEQLRRDEKRPISRFGQLFDPTSSVHRVADDGEFQTLSGFDDADEHLAIVDANSNGNQAAPGISALFVPRRNFSLQRPARRQRIRGIRRCRDRETEYAHDIVSDEFVHDAAMRGAVAEV